MTGRLGTELTTAATCPSSASDQEDYADLAEALALLAEVAPSMSNTSQPLSEVTDIDDSSGILSLLVGVEPSETTTSQRLSEGTDIDDSSGILSLLVGVEPSETNTSQPLSEGTYIDDSSGIVSLLGGVEPSETNMSQRLSAMTDLSGNHDILPLLMQPAPSFSKSLEAFSTETDLEGIDVLPLSSNGQKPRRNILSETYKSGNIFSSSSMPASLSSPEEAYSATLQFPPCDICDGRASGLHYGCNTCEACKNFFRRSLTRKNGYTCMMNNNCLISNTIKMCSACRLAKCYKIGMAKAKCRMGRYTYKRRTEVIKSIKRLENSGTIPSNVDILKIRQYEHIPMDSVLFSLNDKLTVCDTVLIDVILDNMATLNLFGNNYVTKESRFSRIVEHFEKRKLKTETFGQMNAIPAEEYQILVRTFGIDIDGHMAAYKDFITDSNNAFENYFRFVGNIPGFNRLSSSDQSNLLKSTHFEFFMILMHEGYSEELCTYMDFNGHVFHIEEVSDKFISRQFVLECAAVSRFMQKLNLTETEIALLICIVTMSSDRCELENPGLVDSAQQCFTDALLRVIRSNRNNAAAIRRFSKCVDLLVRMRDVTKQYNREYRLLCNDEFISQNLGLDKYILPSEDC